MLMQASPLFIYGIIHPEHTNHGTNVKKHVVWRKIFPHSSMIE